MKVLSLIEPYATLIKEKKKYIETRSYKTNYRGEIYIHASSTPKDKNWKSRKDLANLVDEKTLSSGMIICKATLVDCIYMTNQYVKDIKENNYQEYICGEYKEGRYAWILENITVLEKPIKARGSLNIWNYYNEEEIMSLMKDIDYGYVDKDNNKYYTITKDFETKYILQSPKETKINKVGVCWDQVELERYYFRATGYNIKTYFIVSYDNDKCPTHTFLVFEKDNNYYWFEHSWERFRGIHQYNTLESLLTDIKDKFIKYELNNIYDKDTLCLYEYKKPNSHLSVAEFYKHCENGIKINLK